MRVAIVTESFLPSTNGVTNSVLRVIDTLGEAGHEVLIIAPTAAAPTHLGHAVVRSAHVTLAGFPVAIPTPGVTAALEQFQPDLVHAAAPFWLGGHAIAWAAKNQVPSVAVYQTDVAGYMARYGADFAGPIIDGITAAIHRQATLNLVPTPDGLSYLEGLGVRKLRLWGRGVDSVLFHPARKTTPEVAELRSHIAPRGQHIVGYVGRLAPEKQVERLRELCDLPDTALLIVGDGPARVELEEIFQGHPVTFTGRLDGEDLARAYAAMDVFVHCGTEETFGQTIQEAHASGLPVVAPQKGGQRHLIRSGVDGFLVDHTRWGAFREPVLRLLRDELTRLRFSHEARKAVEVNTWEANNQKLLAYYGELVAVESPAISLAA